MSNCLDFVKLLYSILSLTEITAIKPWNQEITNTSYYEVPFFKNIGIVYDDEKGNRQIALKRQLFMITLINDSYFNYGQRESYQVFFDLMAVIFGSERKEKTVNQFDLLFLSLFYSIKQNTSGLINLFKYFAYHWSLFIENFSY